MEIQIREKEKLGIAFISIILVILVGIIAYADSSPLVPDKFRGDVSIDNSPAPIGTQIVVYVENVIVDVYTLSEEGTYVINVQNGTNGNRIRFNISNQIAGESTRSGAKIVELNLSVYVDRDKDGVPDANDKLIGTKDNISTNFDSLDVFIDGDDNLPATASGVKLVVIKSGSDIILEFPFDFDVNILNLFDVEAEKEAGSGIIGSIFVNGISLTSSQRKTAYVNKLNSTSEYVCVKDAEISSINEISGKCNSTDEFLVRCNGVSQNDYVCSLDSSRYKISGLKNSGISEYACAESWQCSDWSDCSSGEQTRSCSDSNSCGTLISKPATSQSCSSGNADTPSGGGGGGGGGGAVPTTTTTTIAQRESIQSASDDINPSGSDVKGENVMKFNDEESPIIESVPDKSKSSGNAQANQQGFFSGIWNSITGAFKGSNQITGQAISVEQGRGNIWWTIGIVGGIALAIIVVGLILNKMPKKE